MLHHAQKIVGHLCRHARLCAPALAMPATACAMWRWMTPTTASPSRDDLAALAAHYRAEAVQWQQPDEWRLDAQLGLGSNASP